MSSINLHPDSFNLCGCKLTDTCRCDQHGLVDVVNLFLQSVPCQVSDVPTSVIYLCYVCRVKVVTQVSRPLLCVLGSYIIVHCFRTRVISLMTNTTLISTCQYPPSVAVDSQISLYHLYKVSAILFKQNHILMTLTDIFIVIYNLQWLFSFYIDKPRNVDLSNPIFSASNVNKINFALIQ